jgi:hypothetical protein
MLGMDSKKTRERRINLWGWILFVVCAGFFIASSARSGDGLALAASIIFLFGCLLFIVPLLGGDKTD